MQNHRVLIRGALCVLADLHGLAGGLVGTEIAVNAGRVGNALDVEALAANDRRDGGEEGRPDEDADVAGVAGAARIDNGHVVAAVAVGVGQQLKGLAQQGLALANDRAGVLESYLAGKVVEDGIDEVVNVHAALRQLGVLMIKGGRHGKGGGAKEGSQEQAERLHIGDGGLYNSLCIKWEKKML